MQLRHLSRGVQISVVAMASVKSQIAFNTSLSLRRRLLHNSV